MKNLIFVILVVAVSSGCIKDIRPDGLADVAQPTESAEEKGHRLLRDVAQAHGANAFSRHDTYEMEIVDEWKGLVARLGNPWPSMRVHALMEYRANSFDGRATFLDGKREGSTWGLQAWRAYQVDPDGEVKFKKDSDISFILAAIQYLTEFPFRDHRDRVVSYAGTEEIDGVRYERVFLSWQSMEPTTRHDQYVVYIDPATGLVSKLRYTVRDFARFAEGTMHYEDYETIDGIKVARTQSVTGKHTDAPDKYLHRITVKRIAFGTPSVSTFMVDESLPSLGDQKLAVAPSE